MLGKDGYNPSGMSAQISGDLENTHRDAGDEAAQKISSSRGFSNVSSSSVGVDGIANPEVAVDRAIESIAKYKVPFFFSSECFSCD